MHVCTIVHVHGGGAGARTNPRWVVGWLARADWRLSLTSPPPKVHFGLTPLTHQQPSTSSSTKTYVTTMSTARLHFGAARALSSARVSASSAPRAPLSSSLLASSSASFSTSAPRPNAPTPAPTPSPANPEGARAAATASGRTHRTSTGVPLNAPTAAGGPGQNAAYCASLVQRLDPDAWLTSYFWPKREREWWLAIRAFNVSFPAPRACERRGIHRAAALG